MELKAHVQARFPFLGIERVPGDVLTADDLAKTSHAVVQSMVNQKMIVLDGDSIGASTENLDELKQLVVAQGERIAALTAAFEKGGESLQEQIEGLRTALNTLARNGAKVAAKPAAKV